MGKQRKGCRMKVAHGKAVMAGLGAAALLTAVGTGGAMAGSLIKSRQIAHGAIHTDNIHRHAVTLSKINPRARKALKGRRGARGRAGVTGVVYVRAVTSLSKRPDSGNTGNWALDTITRHASTTRQVAVPASNCGPAAIRCWFYTGTVSDTGTFTTDTGANSPNAGAPITGVVTGTIKGVDHFEFYSTNRSPNPALVPHTVTGSNDSTSKWMTLFFPSTATVNVTNELGWKWTYHAPSTCETWVDAASGESGDITGTSACT
jgi:hypothetical protein